MDELEKSGFIQQTIPFDKNSYEGIYRLIDEFSIFYLKFMDKGKGSSTKSWAMLATGQSYLAWCGIAFEAVCLKHVEKIKQGLKIKTEQRSLHGDMCREKEVRKKVHKSTLLLTAEIGSSISAN